MWEGGGYKTSDRWVQIRICWHIIGITTEKTFDKFVALAPSGWDPYRFAAMCRHLLQNPETPN